MRLPDSLRIGKRNAGCDETKTEEEEMVTDSVAIPGYTQQSNRSRGRTGRGGGR